jgi:hypothetical protein
MLDPNCSPVTLNDPQDRCQAQTAHCSAFIARGLTGYDACYAGLADKLGARWLTFDRRAHERIAEDGVSVDLWQGMPADW